MLKSFEYYTYLSGLNGSIQNMIDL